MADQIASLTTLVSEALTNLPGLTQVSEPERLQLLTVMDQLRAAIEPPWLTLHTICVSSQTLAIVMVAIAMRIFDAIDSLKGSNFTADEIDAKTKGDKGLLVRILRLLRKYNFLKEVGKDTYQSLPLAAVFVTGSPAVEAIIHFYDSAPVIARLNEYLQLREYKNPDDAFNAPYQFAHGIDEHYFDHVRRNPRLQRAMNSVLTITDDFRGEEWFNIYPVDEKIIASLDGSSDGDTNRVLFVDIGGGIGQDISRLVTRFPQLAGRVVLQELPAVVDDIQVPLPGVKVMSYDMFTPQPIRGAKSYYMRLVLHDWPNKQALMILKRVRQGMSDDSILLINENYMPDTAAPPFAIEIDLVMMTSFSSLERTESQWKELLDDAGLTIQRIWRPKHQERGSNFLIETTK